MKNSKQKELPETPEKGNSCELKDNTADKNKLIGECLEVIDNANLFEKLNIADDDLWNAMSCIIDKVLSNQSNDLSEQSSALSKVLENFDSEIKKVKAFCHQNSFVAYKPIQVASKLIRIRTFILDAFSNKKT